MREAGELPIRLARGTLHAFGLKMGSVSRGRFAARLTALTEQPDALIADLVLRLLAIRATLLLEYRWMHLLAIKLTTRVPAADDGPRRGAGCRFGLSHRG